MGASFSFDSADRMFAVDASHRITFWNAASERFLNIPARDALGAPCYRMIGGCNMRGQRVCGPGCSIPRLAAGGAAPRPFSLTLSDGNGRKSDMLVSIMLAPSAQQGLWSVLHVLQQGRPTAATDAALTSRERDILQLVAEGLPPRVIAERLYISCATVRNHVQHILAKLQVHSKVEAVAYAYRHQLIGSPVRALSRGGHDDGEEDCRIGEG